MNQKTILDLLAQAPIIAAVKNSTGLEKCLASEVQVVFILYGTVVDIPSIVQQVHDSRKVAIVHLDLIDGLSTRDVAVDYIISNTDADGIISTKPSLVRRAKEKGIIAIRRFFLIDSLAMHNIQKQLSENSADFIEILPGVMPKQIKILSKKTSMPLIAGGLIDDKEDVVSALSSGVVAVSSTNPNIWKL